MTKERRPTEATLEQVPNMGFYLREPSEAGNAAIQKLQENPEKYIIFTIWGYGRGEYYVPMIGVLVDDQMVNLDRRAGLGKEIYSRFQERNKRAAEQNKSARMEAL